MQMWHAVNRGAYVCLASETRHRRNMAPVHVACPKFATRAAVGALCACLIYYAVNGTKVKVKYFSMFAKRRWRNGEF